MSVKKDKAETKDTNEAHMKFGWFAFTPKPLQKIATGVWFGIFLCYANACQAFLINGLVGLVITSLEIRFDFQSSLSSWISNATELAPIPVYLLISIWGHGMHKPRWSAIGMLLISLGAVLFTLPHWTTGTYIPDEEITEGNTCEPRPGRDCFF